MALFSSAPGRLRSLARAALAVAAGSALAAGPGAAQTTSSALRLSDVIRGAAERRPELEAARARVRASEQRPAIVSALEDPMIAGSIDHKPFGMSGMDYSVTLEQRFPLAPVRRHRRESAIAEISRLRAEVEDKALGVRLEAATAFLMLQQRRRMADLLRERLAFARDIVAAANARYAGGAGLQSDVLRAELEVGRLAAQLRYSEAEVRAGEAMLNAAMGEEVDKPVPPLRTMVVDHPLPSWPAVQLMLPALPKLQAGRAEIARAEAEVRVMRDMYRPMATVRAGPAYTMGEGRGVMAMVGVSIPIWRSKLQAGVQEARAMRQMSEAELRAMTRMAESEAAQALYELEAAGAQQTALRDEILPRARFMIEPTLAGYAAGRLPLTSVIETVQALWTVQSDLIEADMRVGLAWTRLGSAIGSYDMIKL